MAQSDLGTMGAMIREAREQRGWTQTQLASVLDTSQSAINRIERGGQNLSLKMVGRIAEALDSTLLTIGPVGPVNLRVIGDQRLSGDIAVKTSKNASVALLCASLLNRGRTTLRDVARIEEVSRILEVLASIGVHWRWIDDVHAGNDGSHCKHSARPLLRDECWSTLRQGGFQHIGRYRLRFHRRVFGAWHVQ